MQDKLILGLITESIQLVVFSMIISSITLGNNVFDSWLICFDAVSLT